MLVSVYITTFNRIDLLKRAVNSVLNQTYTNIELFVADDGSTDGSHQYLTQMENNGLLKAILNTGESKGACYGRNRSIELATGEFITGLDDDDYFEDARIENFINFWQELDSHTDIAGLFDSVIEIRPSGKYKYNETQYVDYLSLRKGNAVGNQIFVPLKYLKNIAGFDEEMPALQDWDTWLRLTQKFGKLVNIQTYSYVIDQVHGGERISAKKAGRVRNAFSRLTGKLQPISFAEKIGLLDAMYSYKQMDINYKELLILFVGLKFRKIAQIIKRRFIK